MKKYSYILYFLYFLAFSFIANSYIAISKSLIWILILVPLFIFINLFAGTKSLETQSKRLKTCHHGAVLLLVFETSALISVAYQFILTLLLLPQDYKTVIASVAVCILTEAILFWNGIICVYLTSVQLGIKHRVLGALFGMIPILNLVFLNKIITIVLKETDFEVKKEQVNLARKEEKVCKTRYPILFVHGVFFRDSKYFNYWGRIPKELEMNGADVFYGNHQSASSIENSAKEIDNRIKEIVEKTGCEKVNIIAHSKGGLDCRYAIAKLGTAPYIASLTTINTPHRGCAFADYLLTKIPEKIKIEVATAYNTALKKLGDENPDFLEAVNDLTATHLHQFDNEMEIPKDIYCQSVGSKITKASGGKFPLNFSYHIVKYFDGDNDGLVSESSFRFGENYTFLTAKGKRGISHGDMIDLNRENIDGFDVREFYVDLVNELKQKGL